MINRKPPDGAHQNGPFHAGTPASVHAFRAQVQAFVNELEALHTSSDSVGRSLNQTLNRSLENVLRLASQANLPAQDVSAQSLAVMDQLVGILLLGHKIFTYDNTLMLCQLLAANAARALQYFHTVGADHDGAIRPIMEKIRTIGADAEQHWARLLADAQHNQSQWQTDMMGRNYVNRSLPDSAQSRLNRAIAPPSPRRVVQQLSFFRGMPQVSHHLPHDPYPASMQSVKIKFSMETYADQPFAGRQYAKFYDSQGRAYVMASQSNRGSFGKLHPCYDVEFPNEMLMMKFIRHVPSRATRKISGSRTAVTGVDEARRETQLTIRAQAIMEQGLKYYDSLPVDHPDSLRKARPQAIPFRIYGVAENEAKSSIIMRKELGDLGLLAFELPREQMAFGVLAMLAGTATLLHLLHEQVGMAHLDLSLKNMTISPVGDFKLIDLGLAAELQNNDTTVEGVRGNIITPESVVVSADGQLAVLGASTDVFALGALVAKFATGDRADGIFHHSYVVPGFAPGKPSNRELIRQFAQWQHSIADPTSGIIRAQSMFAGPECIFKNYFTPIAQINPEVFELIVNKMMAFYPNQRITAASLGAAARLMLPTDLRQRDAFVNAVKGLAGAKSDEEQELYDMMSLYNTWHDARVQEEQARVLAQVGRPRTLPG